MIMGKNLKVHPLNLSLMKMESLIHLLSQELSNKMKLLKEK